MAAAVARPGPHDRSSASRGEVIRTLALAIGVVLPGIGRRVRERVADRILDAPRRTPEEASLTAALDKLGGEVVRFRSRDGGRLAARWLTAEADPSGDWVADPHEAILLLHGYTGSVAPDLVEYAPFLRRTARVLGLDFRGHGESDSGPTTFGITEVEDVAGALAWLGERGVTRVALFGTSMGGIVALASLAVLGDGRLPAADSDSDAPADVVEAPRPRIVAIVGDSVPPRLAGPVGRRRGRTLGPFVVERGFDALAQRLGADPRATEPARVAGLVEDVPVLVIHGGKDELIPLKDGKRLFSRLPEGAEHVVIEAGRHSGSHAAAPERYETEVTSFLRTSFGATPERAMGHRILPAESAGDAVDAVPASHG
jgi:pimeloyl-ACP methyl ester carboxylesterase